MKRYASLLIALIAILAALLLAGCSESEKEPEQPGTTEGALDCEKNGHSYNENQICTVCGTHRPSEGLSFTLLDGSTYYDYIRCGSGTYYEVSGIGTCTDTEIYIPAEYNGLPVKSIGDDAFSNCSSLTSIFIPDGVTNIGYRAFRDCSSLTYNVYDKAKYLGNKQNPYLALITATDESITSCEIHSQTKVIACFAFEGCSSLTGIIIPDGVTSIGELAFDGCSLTSITFPDSVKNIIYPSYESNSLTSVTIGSNITSFDAPFMDFTNLTYNTYGNGMYLGNEQNPYVALIGVTDTSITSCEIHAQTKVIAGYAFFNCSGLTNITIPNGVTNIGYNAFDNCNSLTSITVPDSVTSIGGEAFSECSSLTNIVIPNSVISTGSFMFGKCYSLTSVTIGNGVTSIEDHAFYYCCNLTSITIPNSVTSIGDDAFSGCSSLTSITIPDSVTSIEDYAFEHCSNLTNIVIPDSVTSIGRYAFSGCSSLTSITFIGTQEQWNSISKGNEWNLGCPITAIIVCTGNGSSSDGTQIPMFSECERNGHTEVVDQAVKATCTRTGLTEGKHCSVCNAVFIAQTETPVDPNAYTIQNGICTGCKKSFISEGLEYKLIDDSYYEVSSYGTCTDRKIYIPAKYNGLPVKSIGENAFIMYGMITDLTSIAIPDSVTSIGNNAFRNCSNLTSVTIGNSVTSIGDYAFSYCSNLKTITFTGTQAQWDSIPKDATGLIQSEITVVCTG